MGGGRVKKEKEKTVDNFKSEKSHGKVVSFSLRQAIGSRAALTRINAAGQRTFFVLFRWSDVMAAFFKLFLVQTLHISLQCDPQQQQQQQQINK